MFLVFQYPTMRMDIIVGEHGNEMARYWRLEGIIVYLFDFNIIRSLQAVHLTFTPTLIDTHCACLVSTSRCHTHKRVQLDASPVPCGSRAKEKGQKEGPPQCSHYLTSQPELHPQSQALRVQPVPKCILCPIIQRSRRLYLLRHRTM